jgi:hypothetical protein
VTFRIGALLFLALALPWARDVLERSMAAHMLVQIPLLAVAGALMASAVPRDASAKIAAWNHGGISGILLAVIASSWWMTPRALDASLASAVMELAKFLSLPLLVGAPVALSWRGLGGMGQGFVLANVLPMWAVVGWLYLAAPVRVCNYYLVDQQRAAGILLVWTSVAVAIGAGVFALRPRRGLAV